MQIHDDRDVFQASPDELPVIDIHLLREPRTASRWASSAKVCADREKPLVQRWLWGVFCGRQTAIGAETGPGSHLIERSSPVKLMRKFCWLSYPYPSGRVSLQAEAVEPAPPPSRDQRPRIASARSSGSGETRMTPDAGPSSSSMRNIALATERATKTAVRITKRLSVALRPT